MKLPPFNYFEPESVADACALLDWDPDGSAICAGGTDILVNLKQGTAAIKRLVSLHRIESLYRIDHDSTKGLEIGAMATVNQVLHHPAVVSFYPGICDAARSLAADQVRNRATVVGNLASAVPSADMAPILLAHGAQLRVYSDDRERVIPLAEFFTAPRQTVLEPAEVIVAISLGPPPPLSGSASQRQGGRAALSLPIAGAAAWVCLDQNDHQTLSAATLALGAVAPTPIIASAVGEFVTGKQLTPEVLQQAGELASAASKPIDDLRGSCQYRHELVKVLSARVLASAAERAGRG